MPPQRPLNRRRNCLHRYERRYEFRHHRFLRRAINLHVYPAPDQYYCPALWIKRVRTKAGKALCGKKLDDGTRPRSLGKLQNSIHAYHLSTDFEPRD